MKITIETLIRNIKDYKIGTKIELSGIIYTARDQAHKRLVSLIDNSKQLPINLQNACIYYCGPCPRSSDKVIGSCGPTTSSRMDIYTPKMLSNGVKLLVGKGNRSKAVVEAIKQNKAIYLLATGGVGALISQKVKKAKLIAFEDLGPEAIYELVVEDFPLTVGIDCFGNNLFDEREKCF
ncbi:MAG: FumA C-terminus/TtdB family hydratase beta subunit [Endomicrobiaceae bacterium]|jgi:fumarate hydratase subunit beta|nr:FumA C-terminus/TtdB family hydratase beta subunit [Endomicrobiaceae bacterium]MDD3052807.1 FumA C-terminus/TtdB family hydratase beta subunit [Endomicrobiaceae bacterium]MDD3921939.1 FumA C-terminus/TtdB family hydratase beta subunit [Endomicrobiaceae bacterium]